MIEKIKERARELKTFVLSLIQDKVFAAAFALSFLIWFIYSLSGNFTTVITIPVHITGALVGNSMGTTTEETKSYEIDCKVAGSGFRILRSALFSDVKVNTSELKLDKQPDGSYVVDMSSLEKAINNKIQGMDVVNIYTNKIAFSALTHTTKSVPVDLNLTLNNDGQYMPIGDVIIDPAEITITGQIETVNAITSVKSKYLTISSKESSVSGEVELSPMENIEYSQNSVYYHIRFERYVEKKVTKEIEIRGADNTYSTLPSTVEITLNIAESIYTDFKEDNIKIFIDLSKDDKAGNIHIIDYDKLPQGIEIRDISPRFAKVYLTRAKRS